ncbi:PhzF family phenazine biosynthesis protein [Actinokineospora sp. G85]|uniref:PhzF family phenazine biosynthesis protein n=1 Tax=Actinokineospora sp. G85 TaxID=3406626 RepID=UPI003C76A270
MEITFVDSFTDTPFRGNPAAVVVLDRRADPAWMQAVAAEVNLSETAFVEVGGDGPLPLRWFTPRAEVDLCGHATLAAAHVLGGERRFHTRSGVLTTTEVDGWIEMDFPADETAPVEVGVELAAALPGVTVVEARRGRDDYLVRVADLGQVRAVRPDLAALARLSARGVIVTAAGGDGADFGSRCFYPAYGIDEDPVTGSAHCSLATYWAAETGKSELVADQLSARGGRLRLTLDGARVRLRGQAVTVITGTLSAGASAEPGVHE